MGHFEVQPAECVVTSRPDGGALSNLQRWAAARHHTFLVEKVMGFCLHGR